jgi:hypothetical protein
MIPPERHVHVKVEVPVRVAVSHRKALQVDRRRLPRLRVPRLDRLGSIRHVMTAVAFSRYVERPPFQLRVVPYKGGDGLYRVVRSHRVIRRPSGVREPDTRGLLNVQHIRYLIPRVRIERHFQLVVLKNEWPVLLEKATETAAAWATVEPEQQRFRRRSLCCLDVPGRCVR